MLFILRRDSWGIWDQYVHSAVSKMDNQQGPTVQHGELCSLSCGGLEGRGVRVSTDPWICMAESLCPPETITTLLISYSPIQN